MNESKIAFEKAIKEYFENGNVINCSENFKNLNDEQKSKVIIFLIDSKINQKTISKICGISEPAISQRLRLLKKKNLYSNFNRIQTLKKNGVSSELISQVFQAEGVQITPEQIDSLVFVISKLSETKLNFGDNVEYF